MATDTTKHKCGGETHRACGGRTKGLRLPSHCNHGTEGFPCDPSVKKGGRVDGEKDDEGGVAP